MTRDQKEHLVYHVSFVTFFIHNIVVNIRYVDIIVYHKIGVHTTGPPGPSGDKGDKGERGK